MKRAPDLRDVIAYFPKNSDYGVCPGRFLVGPNSTTLSIIYRKVIISIRNYKITK